LKFTFNKIKLCHIDVNVYESTKEIFEYVDKKLVKGGIIIFDDFGIWGVDGVKKYIYEIHPKFRNKYYFLFNYMGQCILTKKY
jgi:O-methyltransferase|tara:strand:+ start:106 stop:354 length:249 start_codon:yes stop_codon:yes gene_type:complete